MKYYIYIKKKGGKKRQICTYRFVQFSNRIFFYARTNELQRVSNWNLQINGRRNIVGPIVDDNRYVSGKGGEFA